MRCNDSLDNPNPQTVEEYLEFFGEGSGFAVGNRWNHIISMV